MDDVCGELFNCIASKCINSFVHVRVKRDESELFRIDSVVWKGAS